MLMKVRELFATEVPLVAMIHLGPLPGSPRFEGSMDGVFERAARDAEILAEEGMDGLLVENFGDVPFFPDQVPPVTVAAMAVLIQRLRAHLRARLEPTAGRGAGSDAPPWGVNVLRNDVRSALSIAAATGGSFVRVNVHTGARLTDQGLIEGRAWETLRLRETIAPNVAILADAAVKHSWSLAEVPLSESVADLVERGLADAVLITGNRTGAAPAPRALAEAKRAARGVPVWVASGVDPENLPGYLGAADGFIVGSSLKADGRAASPVDRERVRALLRSAGRGSRPGGRRSP